MSEIESDKAQNTANIYHLFLKFLYLNLKENPNPANNNNASTSTNNAWRTFKGRLYTRLHDKRIAELDLSGLANLAYLFFVLIRCFSVSTSLATTQLKFEQIENYFRILNVFTKTKSLDKIANILPLSNLASTSSSSNQLNFSSSAVTSKTNAIKTLLNTKFAALRLWFESSESVLASSNNEEICLFMKQEFIDALNEWLAESAAMIKLDLNLKENLPQNSMNSNQIAK